MAQAAPEAIEVQDIQCRLHSMNYVFHVNDSVVRSNISLLAASRSYGLLFAGAPYGNKMRVFILKNIVERQKTGDRLLARTVQLPSQPNILACNCDGSMLAVNCKKQCMEHLNIYCVKSFLEKDINLLYDIPLNTSRCVFIFQLLWNPSTQEKLAVILTDGDVRIYTFIDGGKCQVEEMKEMCSSKIRSGCWSPCGDKIIFGSLNGQIDQYDACLNHIQTIECESNALSRPFQVIGLQWLPKGQIAASFQSVDETTLPSIHIIDAPEDNSRNLKYTCYGDMCTTSAGPRAQQTRFIHMWPWNILLIGSGNGEKVALLGCRSSADNVMTWHQYKLRGDLQMQMPMTPLNAPKVYPIGFAYDPTSSHVITIDDKTYPPMPMVHILYSNGQLQSYNFVNLNPSEANVCTPPPEYPIPAEFMALDATKRTGRGKDDEASDKDDYSPGKEAQADFEEILMTGPSTGSPIIKPQQQQQKQQPNVDATAGGGSPNENQTTTIPFGTPGIPTAETDIFTKPRPSIGPERNILDEASTFVNRQAVAPISPQDGQIEVGSHGIESDESLKFNLVNRGLEEESKQQTSSSSQQAPIVGESAQKPFGFADPSTEKSSQTRQSVMNMQAVAAVSPIQPKVEPAFDKPVAVVPPFQQTEATLAPPTTPVQEMPMMPENSRVSKTSLKSRLSTRFIDQQPEKSPTDVAATGALEDSSKSTGQEGGAITTQYEAPTTGGAEKELSEKAAQTRPSLMDGPVIGNLRPLRRKGEPREETDMTITSIPAHNEPPEPSVASYPAGRSESSFQTQSSESSIMTVISFKKFDEPIEECLDQKASDFDDKPQSFEDPKNDVKTKDKPYKEETKSARRIAPIAPFLPPLRKPKRSLDSDDEPREMADGTTQTDSKVFLTDPIPKKKRKWFKK